MVEKGWRGVVLRGEMEPFSRGRALRRRMFGGGGGRVDGFFPGVYAYPVKR